MFKQEKWFFAEAISREQQFLAVTIPNSEGEHAAQMLHRIRAPMLISTQDYFRIRIAFEAIAGGDQLGTQFAKVIHLAVVDNAQTRIVITHGLAASCQIDDGKTPVTQADLILALRGGCDVHPAIIRPAVGERIRHLHQNLSGRRDISRNNPTGQPTHALAFRMVGQIPMPGIKQTIV